MDKIGRPRGLIGYDTDINLQRREEGKGPIYRFFRARTVIYVAIIAAVAGIMAYTLATRSTLGISVLHDRNPVFVQLSEGGIRNGYTVRILNKYLEPTDYVLSLEGLPGATIEAVGTEKQQDGWPVITVEPDKSREVRVLVNSRPGETLAESTPITFWVTNPATGESEAMSDFFRAPK